MKINPILNGFLIAASFIIGAITTLAILRFTPVMSDVIGNNNTIITKNETQVYEKGSLAPSVEKIYDAVVVVQSYSNGTLESTGTGFIYKVDNEYAYLLTNEHVITKAKSIKLTLSTDEQVEAKLLGKDEYLDLAVLRMEKKYAKLVANIGSSEKMHLGDTVFTVGSPVGYNYRGSVTSGVLSGKDRLVSISVSNSTNEDWVMRVLQVDASINPGNSGGPLLNANGEVVGICSMKLVNDNIEGMGFAIPIEYAMNHVDALEKGKKIEWPLIGIGMANINDSGTLYRNNIKIKTNLKEGVVIISIKENTGAAKSELKVGDIITEIGGKKTKDIAYLRYELYQHKAGDTVEVVYERNGKQHKTKVTLGKAE